MAGQKGFWDIEQFQRKHAPAKAGVDTGFA